MGAPIEFLPAVRVEVGMMIVAGVSPHRRPRAVMAVEQLDGALVRIHFNGFYETADAAHKVIRWMPPTD